MSGFLHRLVARTIGTANVVRPRPVPRFLPAPEALAPDAGFVAGSSSTDGADAVRGAAQRDFPFPERGRNESAGTLLRPARTAPFDERRAEPQSERIAPAGARGAEGLPPAESGTPAARPGPHEAALEGERVREIGSARADRGAYERRGAEPSREHHALDAVDAGGPRGRPLEHDEFAAAPQAFPRADRSAYERSGPVRGRGADAFGVDAFGEAPLRTEREQRELAAGPLAPMLARPRSSERGPQPEIAPRSGEPAGEFTRESFAGVPRSGETREAEPTIVTVTIGRVEVRSPAEPLVRTIRRDPPPAPEPREQLDAYLRERGKARR